MDMGFDAIKWLQENFALQESDSVTFTYRGQRSMSFETFPGIYRPIDPKKTLDARVRGYVLDYASIFADMNVLDFGSGDGFPSLLIAPYVNMVTGIDASIPRVNECLRNASRLCIRNVKFEHVPVGTRLPFEEEEFEGAVASWSLEQTPNAIEVAREIFRVLKPRSCFRFEPEPLWIYKNGHEQSVWLPSVIGDNHTITIADRSIKEESCNYFGLLLDPETMDQAICKIREKYGQFFSFSLLTIEDMEYLKPFIEKVGVWKTKHPSLASWVRDLTQIGFSTVRVTRSGGWYANRLFSLNPELSRPETIEELDKILIPFARNAHKEEVPVNAEELCLFIHAIK